MNATEKVRRIDGLTDFEYLMEVSLKGTFGDRMRRIARKFEALREQEPILKAKLERETERVDLLIEDKMPKGKKNELKKRLDNKRAAAKKKEDDKKAQEAGFARRRAAAEERRKKSEIAVTRSYP